MAALGGEGRRSAATRIAIASGVPVIASDSEAIQTKPQMRGPSLDCFALKKQTVTTLILLEKLSEEKEKRQHRF